MARNIGPIIGIEGEKEFRQQISDITDSYNLLKTEMRAVSAEFGRYDKSTEGLTKRNDTLNRGIETQKKLLAENTAMLERAREEHGKNSKVAQDWEKKVNGNKEALGHLTRELERNTQIIEENEGGWNKVQRAMESASQKFKSVGQTLTNAITKPAIAAATALAGITLKKGFDRLVGIDDARAKLKALRFEAEEIDVIMDSALESVKGTAFGLDEAATTAANAVAAGIKPGEELTEYLSMTADAAAIAGVSMGEMGGIMNQVQTGQTVYARDLEKLADRGLPIYEWVADAAGTTADAVKGMASEGQISAELFFEAIEKNVGGAALIMGQESFAAAKDNIWASISRIGANFLDAGGEGGGFFSQMKPLMAEMADGLGALEDKAAEIGKVFGEKFAEVVEKVRGFIQRFKELPKSVKSGIGKAALAAVALGPMLLIFGKIAGAIGALSKVFGAISGPVGLAILAIVAVGAVLKKAWDSSEDFRESVTHAFERIRETIDEAKEKIQPAIEAISKAFEGMGAKTGPIFKTIGDILSKTLVPLIGFVVRNVIDAVATVISIFGPLIAAFLNFVGFISNVVSAIAAIFQGDWEIAWEAAGRAVQNAKDFISNIIKALKEFIWAFFGDFLTNIKETFDRARETVSKAMTNIARRVKEGFQNFIDGTKEKLGSFKDTVVDGLKDGLDYISGLPAKFKNWAEEAVKEFVAGIKGKIRDGVDAIKDLANQVLDKFKEVLGIKSPSRVMFDLGTNIIEGLLNALTDADLSAWVENVFAMIKDAFSNGMFNAMTFISTIGDKAMELLKELGIGFAGVLSSGDGAYMGPTGMMWPTDTQYVTSYFGPRESPGGIGSTYHQGIDIGAGYGAPVYAAGDGVVTTAGWLGGYGNTVEIDHGNGLATLYAHLSEILASLGQWVKQGNVIGRVGSTGNSTGPHLHFSTLVNGQQVDPMRFYGYEVGTRYVPYDMVAKIHEGEMIVPKKYNPYANSKGNYSEAQGLGGDTITLNQHFYGDNISPADMERQARKLFRKVGLMPV